MMIKTSNVVQRPEKEALTELRLVCGRELIPKPNRWLGSV